MPDFSNAGAVSNLMPSRQPLAVRLDTSLELLLARIADDDTTKVLATVVATAGSTYRKPGARMLILSDGRYLGLLSGGCLESDLKLHAEQVMRNGVARAVEYDMRGPDDVLFGIGAGCEGAMRVLLEPAGPGSLAAAALVSAGRATRAGIAATLVIVHASESLPLGTYGKTTALPRQLAMAAEKAVQSAASNAQSFDSGKSLTRAFVQHLEPPPHLLICGAGPDAEPVASAALTLGWRVTLVDHRPAYAVPERFIGAHVVLSDAQHVRSVVDLNQVHAAVVMSHHLSSDAIYLRELAVMAVPYYIGLLGPMARQQRLAEALGPIMNDLKHRIHGPVGLDLGAVTPEGIALSIISEIHAWLAERQRTPGASLQGPA